MKCSLFVLAALVSLAGFGCRSSKTSREYLERNFPAESVETEFKRRWIEQRIAELTRQGIAATAAQTRAEEEFLARFNYVPERAKK